MKFLAFVTTKRFLWGLALFFSCTVLAVIGLPQNYGVFYRSAAVIVACVLYTASQSYTADQLSEEEAKEQTQPRLRCVDVLKVLDGTQNLRSNVFRWDEQKQAYSIWQYHNMDPDPAKSVLEIPAGKGCTGHAWQSKKQIWAERAEIFGPGQHALPPEQEGKISPHLQWICSTPIVHPKKKTVIAVLNFDGDRVVAEAAHRDFIMQHAERVATELGSVLSRL